MATIPYVQALDVARASEQNALITQVNTNTNSIESNSTAIDTSAAMFGEMDSRLTALEDQPAGSLPPGTYYGSWTDNNAGTSQSGQLISTAGGTKVSEINVPVGTASGCSLSAGTLTVQQPGLWLIMASLQYGAGTSVRAMWLTKGTAASNPSGKTGAVAGPSMDVQSSSGTFRLAAGESVTVYSGVWQGGSAINIFRALSNNLTATWLAP